jgi:hypothetical protein
MAFGGSELGVAKPSLLLNQIARHPDVRGHERTEGQPEIVQYALMKGLQFLRPLDGELVSVLDLPAGELHQILVDDVANVFEVYGERDDLHGAAAILFVEALARELGDIELAFQDFGDAGPVATRAQIPSRKHDYWM